MTLFPPTLEEARARIATVNPAASPTYSVSTQSNQARTRKRFGARPITTVPVNWLMSQAQFALFDTWMLTYAREWFSINLAGGLGLQAVLARLVGTWTSVPAGSSALWSVNATLEVQVVVL